MSLVRRIARWGMQPVPRIFVLALFVASVLAAALAVHSSDQSQTAARQAKAATVVNTRALMLLTGLGVKIAADEAATKTSATQACTIQARGLKAQRYLTGVLDSLHKLLTLPQTAAQKQRSRANIPPALLREELAELRKLNGNLTAYVKIEAGQPSTRICP